MVARLSMCYKFNGLAVTGGEMLRFWMHPDTQMGCNCVIDLNFSDGSVLRGNVPDTGLAIMEQARQ